MVGTGTPTRSAHWLGRVAIGCVVIAATSSLMACESSDASGEEVYQQIRQGQHVDYSSLSCGQLEYLAEKYQSIGDSAGRASGDSPAATASQMTAMQAWNRASQLYGMYAQRC